MADLSALAIAKATVLVIFRDFSGRDFKRGGNCHGKSVSTPLSAMVVWLARGWTSNLEVFQGGSRFRWCLYQYPSYVSFGFAYRCAPPINEAFSGVAQAYRRMLRLDLVVSSASTVEPKAARF